MAKDVVKAIQDGGGKVTLKTVSGDEVIVTMKGNNVVLKDENGNYSTITATDLEGSNGVIHVIDSVVLPK